MRKLEMKFNLNAKDLPKRAADFVVRRSSLILFGIGFIFLGYCVYMWYQNVYNYEWDEVKKQDYMNNKNAGTSLNRVKFERALADIARRKEIYGKNLENMKDIFHLGDGQPSDQVENNQSSEIGSDQPVSADNQASASEKSSSSSTETKTSVPEESAQQPKN
jgi:hypothetical protein